ncbi:DUF4123 domain-containing protein [Janthinobacterium sp. BJB446]|uniref:DUF4123 domain-containing protein n=1 Tax=Janthinobacterium sp. BJB446 TaxID=2048009 RepID=UPI0015D4FE8F|nr:DUF4123 domain-containing protein [Janthinobacterium sp. BJB446]
MSNDKVSSPALSSAGGSTARADEVLYNVARGYDRTVVLIDQFIDNPLREAIEALSPPAASVLLDDPIFQDDLQRAPMLLALSNKRPEHYALVEYSLKLAQEQHAEPGAVPRICAWLFSHVTLERLRSAMLARLNVRYASGDAVYLRYFDPRVMPHLARLFPSSTAGVSGRSSFDDLLGPVERWCQLDRDGQLIQHGNAQPVSAVQDIPLRIDEPTRQAMERIEQINLVVRILSARQTAIGPGIDAQIDHHLVYSASASLDQPDDQIAYAWRAVAHGQAFTMHPALGELMRMAATQGLPLDIVLNAHLHSLT